MVELVSQMMQLLEDDLLFVGIVDASKASARKRNIISAAMVVDYLVWDEVTFREKYRGGFADYPEVLAIMWPKQEGTEELICITRPK